MTENKILNLYPIDYPFETLVDRVQKGKLVYIEGKLKTRSYDDKEGNKKSVTEILGEQLILLDKKEEPY